MNSVKPQQAKWKILVVFAFVFQFQFSQAQTYDRNAPGYDELRPYIGRNGNEVYLDFNLKYEDGNSHDIAKAIWLKWGGRIIYGIEMHNFRDDHLPLEGKSEYSDTYISHNQWSNQGFVEYYYLETQGALSQSVYQDFFGGDEAVRIRTTIDLNKLTETYGDGDWASFSIDGYYFDRSHSAVSTDNAGLHISPEYTLPADDDGSDELNLVVRDDPGNSDFLLVDFNLKKSEPDGGDALVYFDLRWNGRPFYAIGRDDSGEFGHDYTGWLSGQYYVHTLSVNSFSNWDYGRTDNYDEYTTSLINTSTSSYYTDDYRRYTVRFKKDDLAWLGGEGVTADLVANAAYLDHANGVNKKVTTGYQTLGELSAPDNNELRSYIWDDPGNDDFIKIDFDLKVNEPDGADALNHLDLRWNDTPFFAIQRTNDIYGITNQNYDNWLGSFSDLEFNTTEIENWDYDRTDDFKYYLLKGLEGHISVNTYFDGESRRFSVRVRKSVFTRLTGQGSSGVIKGNAVYLDYREDAVYDYTEGHNDLVEFPEFTSDTFTAATEESDGTAKDEIDTDIRHYPDHGYVEFRVRAETVEGERDYDHLQCIDFRAENLSESGLPDYHLARIGHSNLSCEILNGNWSLNTITGNNGDNYTVQTSTNGQEMSHNPFIFYRSNGDGDIYVRYYYGNDKIDSEIRYYVTGKYLLRDELGSEPADIYWGDNQQIIRASDAYTIPQIPAPGVSVSSQECGITIFWDEPSSDFGNPDYHRVIIIRDGEEIANLDAHDASHGNSYFDTDIQTGEEYTYQTRIAYSRDHGGSLYGAISTAATTSIPALPAPVGVLTEQANCDGGITVSWVWQPAESPTNFIIERQDGSNPFQVIDGNVDGNLRDYTDNSTVEGKQYAYRLAAQGGVCNAVGEYSPVREHSRDSIDLSTTISREGLSTSKGYFSDRTELFWDLTGENEEFVNRFRIYTRVLGTDVTPTLIESVERQDRSFSHVTGDAGVIYEYFIIAERVIETECGFETTRSFPVEGVLGLDSPETELPQTGIAYAVGFRSPTAVVNGNITYQGGIAVPDVKVIAEPESTPPGKSLYFNGNTRVTIPNSSYLQLDTAMTLSAWVKPEVDTENVMIYKGGSYGLEYNGTEAFMFVRDAVDQAAHIVRVPSEDYQPGNWVNLTCTYSSSTGALNLYVNGEKTGETVFVPEGKRIINKSSDPLLLGDYHNNGYEFQGHMDEIRVYNRALSATDVKREYGRITSTDADGLIAYWKVQEGTGSKIYDAAHIGSFFFKHDGFLSVGVSWSDDIPSRTQLGIAAYTNSSGNYSLEGIPYTGNGENFKITPTITLAGVVHEFDPGSQSIYLGEGNTVENRVDFTDISVFKVSGQVLFDFEDQMGSGTKSVGSSGVQIYLDGTTPLVDQDDNPIVTDQNGEFDINIPIGFHYLVFEKEDHILSSNGRWPSSGFFNFIQDISGVTLYDQTTHRFVGSVAGGTRSSSSALFSGEQVNNIGQTYFEITSTDQVISRVVETDTITGVFSVDLPPLQYNISSVKWRADDLVVVPSSDIALLNLSNESAYEGSYELDSTRVPVLSQVYPELAARQAITDFRINTMDATTISYSWTLERDDLVNLTHQWISNTDTIIYFVDTNSSGYPSGDYTHQVDFAGTGAIDGEGILPNALLLIGRTETSEVFEVGVEINNVTSRPLAKYDTLGYEYVPDTTFYSVRRDFVHRVAPTLEVTTLGDTIFGGEAIYSYNGGEEITAIDLTQLPYPTFFSNEFYELEITAAEVYSNKDNQREYQIPVTDGTITVNSSIGIPYTFNSDGERVFGTGSQLSLDEDGRAVYLFTGGNPNTTQITSTGEEQNSFTTTINASLETSDYNVTWPQDPVNDPQRAYVMGRVKIPGASFVTEAPETVEMILRDPPGSDSYAYREQGTSYTMTEEYAASGFGSIAGSTGGGVGLGFAIGGSFVAHGELSGDAYGTVTLGMSTEMESSAGSSVERSIEYVETISTNADPIEVGASDLFVAKSQNLEAGYALKVMPLPVDICGGNCFGEIITLEDGSKYQMGLIQDSYVSADGLPTYVLYTENHIVTVLIPELEDLRNSLLVNSNTYTSNVSADHPYFGTNNDDPVWGDQVTSDNPIKTEVADLSGPSYTYDYGGDLSQDDSVRYYNQQIRLWKEVLALNEIEKWAAMQASGLENISLASGVTLERSVTNTAASVSTLSFELSTAVQYDFDVDINAVVALRADLDAEVGMKANNTSTRGEESANTTGYVLLDSDENDLYSINVAPGVGSSGPVFSTVGGQTSCPYEPAKEMKYATPEYIDRAIAEKMKVIEELEKSKNLTDIVAAQVEEQIAKAGEDVAKIEKDIRDYSKTIEGLIKRAADAEGIQEDVQKLLLGVVEGVPGILQTAVEPVVSGVNSFISTVKDFSIPIPFAGDVAPFESIPEIPIPDNPSGDLAVDMEEVQGLVEQRMREVAQVAKDAIDSGNELIVRLQKRLKDRLFDINKLQERKLELELDIDRINAEIDALNQQIVLFEQLKQTLQNSTEPILLSNATLQREKPTMQINGAKTAQVYNVPADESANFTLLLNNESESGHSQYYAVEVLDQTNPNGLILKIDGETLNEPRAYWVDGNSSINKVMTVERGPFEYDYSDVQVVIHSTCQYDPNSNTELIVDTVSFDVKFIPTCSEVAILAPQDNWVGNNSSDGVLPVHIGEYDINSTGLEYIQIEYKASSSSDWLQMVRYYRDENVEGWTAGDPTLPQTGNEFVYSWDFAALGTPDGNYDIKVVAQCELAKTESEIHSGLIDTVNPHLFGSPDPADGVYSAGDEIAIQFNEPINEGLIQPSNFKITGILNGADIRHNASLYFGGTANQYMEIEQGINLTRKSFSVDMYVKRDGTGPSVLFAQGGATDRSLVMGFDDNDHVLMSVDGEVLISDMAITDSEWHHLAFVYDHTNSDAIIYIDAEEHGLDNSFAQDYQSSGRIFIGKSTFGTALPFSGNIHELRIWNVPMSNAEVSIAATKRMTASERGLVGNWQMEEANGDVAQDHVRSNHAKVYGQWAIEPGGLAYAFDGTSYLEASSPAFSSFTDFTLEFWVNGSAVTDSVTFLSNGRGDSKDSNSSGWSVGTNQQGELIIKNNHAVIPTEVAILNDAWNHIALSINRVGNAVCYINGEEAAAVPASTFAGFGGNKLWIGARGWFEGTVEEVDQHFTGSIDEIRIWNLAKRADHIQTEIQNKLNGDETGLVLYYPFESYQDIGGGILGVNQDIANQANTDLATVNDLAGASAGQFVENTPAIKLPRPVENVDFNFTSNNDQIVISPSVEVGRIENVTLTISVQNIRDLNDNTLASPVTWTAYVDRSTLNWVESEKSFEVPIGEGVSFTADIFNEGGNIESFSLTNLPSWLTSTPSNGNVEPLTKRTISFTVSDGTNIGSYVQDIVMENSFGFDERLILNLNVFENPPEDWTVNPEDYEYSISVLSRIRIKGEFSRDENDLIAAFVNGECRGVAHLKYIPTQDNYQAYISVYSNELTGETIDYRIWNASEGLVHTFVTNDNADVETFSADGFYGTIINPVIFDAGANIERTQDIKSGWQWLSFNLTSSDFTSVNTFMKEFEAADGDQIKSNQYYDQYDPVNGWVGTITATGGIQSGEMYKFRLSNSGKLKYRGEPVDPGLNPVTLNQGWNWVSFLGHNLIPINEALANVAGMSVGDVIKSQRQFATYGGPGVGWIGSLEVMEPGQGYMYRAAGSGSIVYPQVAVSSRVQRPDYQYIHEVGLDASRFPDNMNMIIETNNSYDYLLAYAGEELRGIAVPEYNPVTGATAYFMTAFGDAETTLTFEGIKGDWSDILSCEETIVFSSTSALGTLSQPVLMIGTVLSTVIDAKVQVYPNPVVDQFEIKLPEGSFERVSIMTLSGQELLTREIELGEKQLILDVAHFASGVYLLKVMGVENETIKLVIE